MTSAQEPRRQKARQVRDLPCGAPCGATAESAASAAAATAAATTQSQPGTAGACRVPLPFTEEGAGEGPAAFR